MDVRQFFCNPLNATQRQYEALRAFYCEGMSSKDAAVKFKLSPAYFVKVRMMYAKQIKAGKNPFFEEKKPGPKNRFTKQEVIQLIVEFRKKNYSIVDIKTALAAQGYAISLDTIDKILKEEGFAPLPKRKRLERLGIQAPKKIKPPETEALVIQDEELSTEQGVGPLVFLPLIAKLGIIDAIKKAGYPETSVLNSVSSIMSILALKLLGKQRYSHDASWRLDRAPGLFAGLNVLPGNTTLATYSYRTTRVSNRKLLAKLCKIFTSKDTEQGEFNLDFKAIPHWGDISILEKNWNGSRSRAMKSVLSLIVQQPENGYISYTDAEIKHSNQNDAILEFVDFWKKGNGKAPKMLIFDSKLTTYQNLNKLDEDNIKFLTLRRRGKNIINLSNVNDDKWQRIQVDCAKNKKRMVKVYDHHCKLRNYDGEVREIILTDHGRSKPAFLITNDFDLNVRTVVRKYAKRWLVEQEIAEQVNFFHLNQLSSSVVIKVDLDLTLSLLAHNLYRHLASYLKGFESCTAATLYRNFLENGATIKIKNNKIMVFLKKKIHLPLLLDIPWLKTETPLPWLNSSIIFSSASFS